MAEARIVAIVSAMPGDGKTVVTASVAVAAATDGARVLVVDADPRNRSLSHLIKTVELERTPIESPKARGEQTALNPNANELAAVRVFTQTATFDLLLTDSSRSSNAWKSNLLEKFFDDARETYDLVLIDTPGILSWSEAAALAIHADAAVIVVPKNSGVAEVTGVVSILQLVGTAPLGFVHNLAPLSVRRDRRNSARTRAPGTHTSLARNTSAL